MPTAFISGHLNLTAGDFARHYQPAIDEALQAGDSFVVGDASGADTLAQQYLHEKTESVLVYHMFSTPRNNSGFETRGGFETDSARDSQMTADSDYDIAWVRPGRETSGTQKNLDRRQPKPTA